MSETTARGQLPYGVPPPGFRLPDAAHVGAVHLQVADLQRSLSYYGQVLGLRAHSITDTSAALSAHGDERPLVTLHAKPGVTRARQGAFGLYHFAILLPERAALGRFAALLAALGVRPGMADHLVSDAFYLWDPDGLGTSPEFSAFSHGAGVGLAKIIVAVPGVLLPEPLRNQLLNRHAEQLLTGVTEQTLRKLVDDDDVA